MRFDQDFIDRVLQASDLVDLISKYTNLKSTGSNMMGLCPFPDHNEKTPSFSVSPDKQLYHCFGCKKGGNSIHFLQDLNGHTFPEAIEILANQASIPLPKTKYDSQENDKKQQHQKALYRAAELANECFKAKFQAISESHPAKKYLASRGIEKNTIDKFQISYSENSWDHLVQYMARKSMPMGYPSELGLVKRKKDGSSYFDIFRNRIMFPIINPMGKVLGFGGRVLSKEDQPKYLNSPESSIFYKGKLLYGLHETSKYIRAEDQAVLVEGYMDLISLYQAGIQNVAANLGTALTLDQAKLVKKYSQNVVVLFDGDKAGQMAMQRSLPILLEAGVLARGMTLPDGMDPDDFIKSNGVEALKTALDKSEDLFIWFLKQQVRNFHAKPSEKLKIMDNLLPVLTKVQDFRLLKLYFAEISYHMEVEISWVEQAFNTFKREQKSAVRPQMPAKPSPSHVAKEKASEISKIDVSSCSDVELQILNLVLHTQAFLDKALELKLHDYFMTAAAKDLFTFIEQGYRQNPNNFDKLGNSVLNFAGKNNKLTSYLDTSVYGDAEKNEKLFELCIQKLKKVQIKNRLQQVKSDLKLNTSKDSLQNLKDIILATQRKKREEIEE